MKPNRLVRLTLIFTLFVVSCQLPGDGLLLLTREAEVSDEYSGWGSREYYTGMALQEEAVEPAVGNYIYLEVNIPMPGRYYPWILAALDQYDTLNRRELKLSITPRRADSRSRVDSVVFELKATRALEWMSTGGAKQGLDFPDFGSYFLIIEAGGDKSGPRIIIDKVLLSNRASFAPGGYAVVNDTAPVIIPPAWAFGVLYGGYTNQAETRNRIDRLIDADLPIDGYWIDSWFWNYADQGRGPRGYLDFRGDTSAYPDLEQLWGYLEQRQVKAGVWIWNAIQETGNEAVFQDFADRDFFDGVPSLNTDGWHNATKNTLIGDIDFENPEAVAYWKAQLEPLFRKGLDFLKLDRSSAVPFLKAAFEATQELGRETGGRGFILSHLHSAYDPEMKRYPAKWTGDAKIAWTQPDYPDLGSYAMGGFRENVGMVANPRKSTYEIPFLTHDAGGYNYFGSREQSDTLYMRWVQFAMLNPITTIFSSPENPTANLPFHFSPQALSNFRFYSHLKRQLFPYIYSYAHETRQTGRKMIQGDADHPDQYLFGRELLVAPVVVRGAQQRRIFLPPGQWIDFYDHTVYSGDTTIRYDAPVDRLPLLVRAGSIIPFRTYRPNTGQRSVDTLLLRLYPGDQPVGTFTLWEDDGHSNGYLEGEIAKTTLQYRRREDRLTLTLGKTEGAYDGMASERILRVDVLMEIAPAEVLLNGKALSESLWEFDADRHWLKVNVGPLPASRKHKLSIRE